MPPRATAVAVPRTPEEQMADMSAQLKNLVDGLATQKQELETVKTNHAAELDKVRQDLADANKKLAETDADDGDDLLYVPYVPTTNPFFPRPASITLAPQVYALYGDSTFDALRKRSNAKDQSLIKEYVTLTGALSRMFDAIHQMEADRELLTEAIEEHVDSDAADRFQAVNNTISGVYDLLHNRHQYVALGVSLEANSGEVSIHDLALMKFVESELYGVGGAEAGAVTSAPKISKALKKFGIRQSGALLTAAAKATVSPAKTKSTAQEQTDAAQAKSRREREAAKRKKLAGSAATAP